eukprot:368741-Prorocentrum_minimum.AAC.1
MVAVPFKARGDPFQIEEKRQNSLQQKEKHNGPFFDVESSRSNQAFLRTERLCYKTSGFVSSSNSSRSPSSLHTLLKLNMARTKQTARKST